MQYQEGMEVIDSDMLDTVLKEMKDFDPSKYTAKDVRNALKKDVLSPDDFAALLSPVAGNFLEEMAQRAMEETRKHFGNSIYMFTPLYISNYCENKCVYCGFNCTNEIRRAKLDTDAMETEMKAIADSGLEEILILTGESPKESDVSPRQWRSPTSSFQREVSSSIPRANTATGSTSSRADTVCWKTLLSKC